MSDEARMVTVASGALYRWFRGESMRRGCSLASLMRVALIWYMTNSKEGSLYDDPRRTGGAVKAGALPARLGAVLGGKRHG